MTDEKIFDNRRKALEESFFAKHNARLLEELRTKEAAKKRREALAAASGITDHEILDRLIELDIHAESFAALSLAPLVLVAWADGKIDEKENQAALRAAEEAGLQPGDVAYQLLEGWLMHEPPANLLATWKDYVEAVTDELTPEGRAHLRHRVVDRARRVAEAAGGFLGIGSVSKEEAAVIEELEEALPEGDG